MEINKLSLLVPEDLPTCMELIDENRKKILYSLNFALKAIDCDCYKKGIFNISLALKALGTTEVLPSNFNIKNAKLYQDILVYDDYFNVNRITTKNPEISLIQAFLITYQRFLQMCDINRSFDSECIEKQRQGAKAFIQLMFRVFNL